MTTKTKVRKNVRLEPQLADLLKVASEEKLWTETVVIEQALKRFFISEGLLEDDKKTA